ncbi:hypothetical protein ACFYLB_07810 [Proteus mirabilis]
MSYSHPGKLIPVKPFMPTSGNTTTSVLVVGFPDIAAISLKII